jgi:gliding motility-associated-like protein
MLKTKLICILLAIAQVHTIYAQQNNIWYFGRKAGLDFNATSNTVPTVLTNSAMNADEGCASVCDLNGRLLFYTNGITVYNRNHQVMQNGDGLAGNISALQSSLIIPQPGSDSLYYIFTADAVENNFANGYQYSVIDISLDHGLGAVIQKNILLISPGTERMAAVRHRDGISVWLITNDNNSNVFRAWLINCQGLQPNPVVSTTGLVLDQYQTINVGMLKASPDAKHICQTSFPVFDELVFHPNFAQLFDFDNASGILSNPKTIGFPDAQITTCEFSPDSKLLYLLRPYEKKIDQVDAKLGSAAAIISSRTSINVTNGYIGIQLAPDQKIYLANTSPYMGVVNDPNIAGAGCNFVNAQIDLSPTMGYLGLPAFINDLSADVNNSFTYTILDSCSGNVQFNGTTTMGGTLQWFWDFGDGITSTLQNPIHLFTPSNQLYTVTLSITSSVVCGNIKRSKVLKPRGVLSSIGFEFIDKCDSGYVRFINTSANMQSSLAGQFTWDFGDGFTSTVLNPTHSYGTPGLYTVKLKLSAIPACLEDSVTHVLDLKAFTIHASPPQTVLIGEKVFLSVSGSGVSFQWLPSTWLNDSNLKRPVAMPLHDIMYTVTASNQLGCKSKDSVLIHVLPLDDIYVPSGFTPNNDGRNDIIKPFYGEQFILLQFSIYNRWGQQVFFTSARGEGWNGMVHNTIQDPGVYVWVATARLSNDPKSSVITRKGTFVLIK